jgi:hypothetical protein
MMLRTSMVVTMASDPGAVGAPASEPPFRHESSMEG